MERSLDIIHSRRDDGVKREGKEWEPYGRFKSIDERKGVSSRKENKSFNNVEKGYQTQSQSFFETNKFKTLQTE